MSSRDLADSVYEATLPPEEFQRRLRDALASLDGPEGEEIAAQIAWFKRRYPTPIARLQYIRRKHAEAERLRGVARLPR